MNTTGVRYWRSLDDLVRTPEFEQAVRREFPDDEWDRLPPATRRSFLKVMGASLAFAGLTACRWPQEEIVPFASRPEGFVPGVPVQFATAYDLAGAAVGMLVTSYDGRPIKAEGNPQHPTSRGALSGVLQATLLEMYDPDRSRSVVAREGGATFSRDWQAFAAAAQGRFTGDGTGVAVLSEASSSPTLAAQRARLERQLPQARWYEYEPLSWDAEREGTRQVFGRPLRVVPKLADSRVIACFDADPLFEHPAALALADDWAASRAPEADAMSRLWVAEPVFTLTGSRADQRLAVRPGRVAVLLTLLARELAEEHGLAVTAQLPAGPDAGTATAAERQFVTALAADLAAHRGAGVVLAGPRQGADVHALAAAVNHALGAVGRTVDYLPAADSERPDHLAAIGRLAERMRAGEIETLLILGGNPVYDAPAELGFGELLEKVGFTAHLSLYQDETSRRCVWHLPRAHALEAWGDGRAWDGTWTCQQPLIQPLYGGRSPLEVVALVLGDAAPSGHDLVRDTARAAWGGADFEARWRRALHDGLVADTATAPVSPAPQAAGVAAALQRLTEAPGAPAADTFDLVLLPDPKLHDGRWANNGWLQELPETITKITWDNALLLSPVSARSLGVADGEVAAVSAGGTTVELPVYVVPGQAAGVAAAWLGHGRQAAGQVGNGVGVDLYPLRTTAAPHVVAGVEIRPTGRRYQLATTQDHHAIDTIGFEARNIRIGELIREVDRDAYLEDPEHAVHPHGHHELFNLWQQRDYEGEQWGMSIDLNSCIGCNACVVACQAENNIPLVGRQQVINGREMHWIRIDRYFRTPAGVAPDEIDDARLAFQPVACVQCENAPCEQVCPVGATQHTHDGLNAMTYNRCIGTRYCSNNCPYKVRRFNFFNYQKGVSEVRTMQYNPEVTVRSRGVMEKCTYCVQRIQNVRIVARNERRPIRDGEIVTACAQTCPTRAIVFGNLNDPSSEVAKRHSEHRSYATLAELNIRPRTRYLARLTNPVSGGEPPPGESGHGGGRGEAS